jgi:MSHA biogenesis protein MshK
MKRAAAVALALVALPCWATENLPDPTRPPASLGLETAEMAPPVGPILQSTLISPGRRQAIINGRVVRVGDKVGSAEVAEIREGEVVLRNGKETQTLSVFAAIRVTGGASRADTHEQVGAAAQRGRQQ